MRNVLAVLVVLLTGCGLEQVEPERTISVTGVGMVATAADVAVVRLGVETREATSRQSMQVNNERTAEILAALQTLGVADEDIRTESLQLNPRYESNPGRGQQRLVGYRASNIVTVRLRDLASAGEAIDAASSAGANRIDSISFEVADPTAATEQARDLAWADAYKQASQLAELAGASLSAVKNVNLFAGGPRPSVNYEMSTRALSAVPIAGGQQQISVQVQVTWTLENHSNK